MTDFPTQGDDLKISLRNSERPQFDFAYAQRIKDDHPCDLESRWQHPWE